MSKQATLATFRGSNPNYADYSDDELIVLLHEAFYSDMDLVEFDRLLDAPPDPLGIRSNANADEKAPVVFGSHEFLLIDNEATLGIGQALIDRGIIEPECPSERILECVSLIAGHMGLLCGRLGQPELIDGLTSGDWEEIMGSAISARDEILAAQAGAAN